MCMLYACMYVYVCAVCAYVCTFAILCMYLCSVRMYVCICVCTYSRRHTYVNMYECAFVDRPVVEITAVAGGCGYVSVSWTTAGNSDVCSPVQYNVTLSSSTMNMTVSITSMNTHNFTELPDDTQFTVTVIGINVMGIASDPVSTAVTKNCTYVLSYVRTYMYNIRNNMYRGYVHTYM